MIKLVFCLHRLPHLTLNQFHDYWRNNHAPLIARHAETLGIVHYVQSHSVFADLSDSIRETRGGPEPFDGVAEVWYANEENMKRRYTDPVVAAAADLILEDERNFIDHSRSPVWYCKENEVIA